MTRDPIRDAFLACQYEEGMALAQSSDILRLTALDGRSLDKYVAEFRCTGLVRGSRGEVEEAGYFVVGIWFPLDYLRRAEPSQVLSWIGPRSVFHPNISDKEPYICVGRLAPGTTLVDIVYQCFEIITYKKVTMREDDALNRSACAWARANQHRFPIDPRPLKRRAVDLHVSHRSAEASP